MLRAKTPRKTRNTRQKTSRMGGGLSSRLGNVDWGRLRIKAVAGLFGVIWCLLWMRAWHVQVIEGDRLAGMARRQHVAAELVTGQRGSILDRNGQVLARSVEMRSVYVHPLEVQDVDNTAAVLSRCLDLPLPQVRAALSERRRFAWLARKVDDRKANLVREAKLSGVGLTTEYERIYPFRQMAGQLLGFVGLDDKGLEGVERAMDDSLAGTSTRMVKERDAAGRRFYLPGSSDNDIRGGDVRLTIDMQVQFFAEEALADAVDTYEAKWGGALVVDVQSGDILAWAQYPFFNPNAYREYTPARWRNRLASDALEPGSTFKPFLVAAGLQEGVITPDTLFYCEKGKWKTRTINIRDTHSYDWLPVNKIMRYSSNIGCAKIGLELGTRRYHDYLVKLGFGERTGVPVAESKGILRKPRDWSEADLITASFGQSVSVTALQMAQGYLTLANDGVLKKLRLFIPENGAQQQDVVPSPSPVGPGVAVAAEPRRIFSHKVARQVMDMLRDVVEEDGTGTRARIAGITIGGKTGTAQKADSSGSYGKGRLASFVGLVPIDRPRYLIFVMVDEPTRSPYGGVVAAPVFKHVALRTMAYHGLLPEPVDTDDLKVAEVQKKGAPQDIRQEVRREISERVIETADNVPDVVGKPVRRAVEMFATKGRVPVLKGTGQTVVKQSPEPGAAWQDDKEYILWLSERS